MGNCSNKSSASLIQGLPDINNGFTDEECKCIFFKFDRTKTGFLDTGEAQRFLKKYIKHKKVQNGEEFTRIFYERRGLAQGHTLSRADLQKKQDHVMKEAKVVAPGAKVAGKEEVVIKEKVATQTQKGNSSKKKASSSELFDLYVVGSEEADILYGDNLNTFFTDVGVDPDGIMTLGLSWKLRANSMGEISKSEFVEGFLNSGCSSLTDMKALAKSTETSLKTDWVQFQSFYMWVFELSKESDQRKTIDKEMAEDMWGLVLKHHFALLPKWLDFFHSTRTPTVPKDLWEQLLGFVKQVKQGLEKWEDDGSWPSLIDDFVGHLQGSAS